MDGIGKTYGALLLGTLVSSLLSGMVLVQCIMYGKAYRQDTLRIKAFVWTIWLLDMLHNVAVWSSIWTWFIVDFGSAEKLDIIPESIPLSIIVTAILTIFVHAFFVLRIFILSQRNWFICAPIMFLAVLRLVSAFGTSHLMFGEPSLDNFKSKYRWIFSVGLGLSSAVDVLITCAMMFILRSSRTKSLTLGIVIDSLIVYTLENGAITTYVYVRFPSGFVSNELFRFDSAATIVSMICFLTMDNLIFLALYFIIAKLYANSVLAMLNCRKGLRESHDKSSIPEDVINFEIINLTNSSTSSFTTLTSCDCASEVTTGDLMLLRAERGQLEVDLNKSVEVGDIWSVSSPI
ncbi:hypothetical protein WG66_008545 [Moniliophthora roreri]|uniref:DUF6534 domain-containing protein n=1 Tax=Moniliophthora roreri TaxID=221103 RepID=A0A0W0EV00_MONRR|nr:hypothetical protein WG66_008545 [Moniliophthora roreri]